MAIVYELKRGNLGCYLRWTNYDFTFKKQKGVNDAQMPTAGTDLALTSHWEPENCSLDFKYLYLCGAVDKTDFFMQLLNQQAQGDT